MDIKHALEVAGNFEYGTQEWLAALLHDVLEDTNATAKDLRKAGIPHRIVETVEILTRSDTETYAEYIARVSFDDTATSIKVADLKTNLARMNKEHESLRSRYEKALDELIFP